MKLITEFLAGSRACDLFLAIFKNDAVYLILLLFLILTSGVVIHEVFSIDHTQAQVEKCPDAN